MGAAMLNQFKQTQFCGNCYQVPVADRTGEQRGGEQWMGAGGGLVFGVYLGGFSI